MNLKFNIPHEWMAQNLDELFHVSSGVTAPPQSSISVDGTPFLRVSDLANAKNGWCTHTRDAFKTNLKIWDAGTIVFPKSGESIRSEVRARLASPMAVVGHLACLTCKNIDPSFGFFLLQNILFSAKIEQTSLPALSLGYIKEFPVLVPPLVEQQKIASVLSDLDALIEAQEALIAKKKDVKAATMELLLTGKKRLPGFSGKWGNETLSTICHLERGKFSARPRNDPKFFGGHMPFYQTGDVANSTIYGNVHYTQTLNSDGITVSRVFPQWTLYITIAANIGDIAVSKIEAACTDSLVAVTPKSPLSMKWLYQELKSRKFELEKLATPGAQANLNLEILEQVKIRWPTVHEQNAIGDCLHLLDSEIQILDIELTKMVNQKNAAMHKLLTGEIRLA